MAKSEPRQIVDDDGRTLDARFLFDRIDGVASVYFASANTRKNTRYNTGMHLLLSRLRALDARIIDGLLQARGTERLDESERRVHVKGHPYPISLSSVNDVNSFRVSFCRALAFTANASTKHGNMQRSCRICFEVDSTFSTDAELEDYLTFGAAADDAADRPAEGGVRTEGGTRVVISRRPERDRTLRAAAIRIHGLQCGVCRFDFGEFYGRWGEGFAEVHHVMPLGSSKQKRETNPQRT